MGCQKRKDWSNNYFEEVRLERCGMMNEVVEWLWQSEDFGWTDVKMMWM